MTIKNMRRYHPNKYLILLPAKWDAKTNYCIDWKILKRAQSVTDAVKAVEFYESEGFIDAVALSTMAEDCELYPELSLPPDLVAKFFRVCFGDCWSHGRCYAWNLVVNV